MQGLSITLDATSEDSPLDHYEEDAPKGTIVSAGVLPDATEGGLPAVVLVIALEDGSTVVGHTTLALLVNATRAMAARYPDPRP
jgi:hypothetical protein